MAKLLRPAYYGVWESVWPGVGQDRHGVTASDDLSWFSLESLCWPGLTIVFIMSQSVTVPPVITKHI